MNPPMTAPIPLVCPSCGAAIRTEDLDHERGVASCASCRAAMLLPQRPAARSQKPRFDRPPGGVVVTRGPGGTTIRRRWFTPAAIFLLVFTVIWDGFLLFWYGAAFATGAPLAMILFPLLHVAAGVGMTWFTLASFVNTTTLVAGPNGITVRHGPVPWPGSRDIPRGQASQLYCRMHRGSKGGRTYDLWIATADGRRSKLLGFGAEREHCLWFEQEIEASLGIRDRPEEDDFTG